jgi:hypothetical protein
MPINRCRRTQSLLSILVALFILVGSSPGIAQEASVTRIEQDDPGIAYSGNWYSNDSPNHSGGVSALTNARGARATLTFTGTGIRWIGVMDRWSGFATVSLDGAMTIVNAYRDADGYQEVLFAATGLSSGTHTLSIEVTHERGPGTEGSWIWIDAFDVENGSLLPGGVTAETGRVEESHAALLYQGHWYSNLNPGHSGGSATMATDAGARVTIGFNGTGIAWHAYRDEWSGVARVYVDDVEKATVDNYRAPAARGVPYRIDGLAPGTHTLTIEVTGTHNESAKGSWIWLDAFDVTP